MSVVARSAAALAWRHPDLPAPSVQEWSDLPVVLLDHGVPWLYGPLEHDPLLGPAGSGVLPRRERRILRERAERGPRFDAVAVAHELDPRGPVRVLLPMLRDGRCTCAPAVARELVGPPPAHPAVARAAGLLAAAVRAPRALAGVADAVLDPIVFGVVAPHGLVPGEPCLWYPLAAWRW